MRKVFIWIRWVDDIFLGTKPPDGNGGAELQMAIWARILARKGFKVYTFCWRLNAKFIKVDNIKFLWVPWIRKIGVIFYFLRYVYLMIIKPDFIIIKFGNDLKSILRINKIINARIVYMLSSDNNTDNSFLYLNALKAIDNKRDLIIAQNTYQEKNIKLQTSGKRVELIFNIYEDITKTKDIKYPEEHDFIWVSIIREGKRPELFIEMAKKMPEYKFCMIAGGVNKNKIDKINAKSEKLSNINFYFNQTLKQTNEHIEKSKILVSTSEREGFPNVFLQAWSSSKPVISMVNPNEAITKHKLGYFVTNINDMIKAAKELHGNKILYEEIKNNINEYFYKNHSPETGYYKLSKYLEYDRKRK